MPTPRHGNTDHVHFDLWGAKFDVPANKRNKTILTVLLVILTAATTVHQAILHMEQSRQHVVVEELQSQLSKCDERLDEILRRQSAYQFAPIQPKRFNGPYSFQEKRPMPGTISAQLAAALRRQWTD